MNNTGLSPILGHPIVQQTLSGIKADTFRQLSQVVYPYFFQEAQRTSWVEMKRSELITKSRSKKMQSMNDEFIIVKKIKQLRESTKVLESWVVSKTTLQVVGRFDGEPDNVDLQNCRESNYNKLPDDNGAKNEKIANLVFFGRCRFANRSVTIEDSKVSAKHMLLERVTNANQTSQQEDVRNFIACLKANSKRRTRTSVMFCSLTAELQNILISFLAHWPISKTRYLVWDNGSSNGTLMRLNSKLSAASYLKQQLRLSIRKDHYNFKIFAILQSGGSISLATRLAAVLSPQGAKIKVIDRNLDLEDETKYENMSVLILEITNFSGVKFCVMYSQQCPYMLVKNNYDLEIIREDRSWEAQECLGRIQYFEEWELEAKAIGGVYLRMAGGQKYEVADTIDVKLSQTTYLTIQTNQRE